MYSNVSHCNPKNIIKNGNHRTQYNKTNEILANQK